MFTGIIETRGRVASVTGGADGGRLGIAVAPEFADLAAGRSVAVDGACLTVVEREPTRFWADLSAETLRRTTLGRLAPGQAVNLERPLRVGDRLGGHLVTGHIDGVGTIAGIRREGDGHVFRFRTPPSLWPLLVPKGSVAVDGISLTVAALGDETFDVAVIPFTFQETTLGSKGMGAAVNLEMDLVGKYVARLLGPHLAGSGRGLDLALLREHGFA